MVWLGIVGLIMLGAVAQVHLRRTTDDDEYGLTAGQRRARSSPDGGRTAGPCPGSALAAEVKRARRRARNLEIAGRRVARPPGSSSPPTPRWWRRTARR